MRAAAAWLALVIALGGCANLRVEHALGCRRDEQPMIRDTLYFGRSIPGGGEVSDADWQRFERDAIVPAFPQGFTVLDAHGSWRDAKGTIASEANRVVVIIHGDDAKSDAAVRQLLRSYRQIFTQESVLRERSKTCATF
ncbi:MAG TPA: DUF3574 domain-containing protein [Rudaea sp.]|nr:DUF3574 domain-containing protein [Rudaea sp.]